MQGKAAGAAAEGVLGMVLVARAGQAAHQHVVRHRAAALRDGQLVGLGPEQRVHSLAAGDDHDGQLRHQRHAQPHPRQHQHRVLGREVLQHVVRRGRAREHIPREAEEQKHGRHATHRGAHHTLDVARVGEVAEYAVHIKVTQEPDECDGQRREHVRHTGRRVLEGRGQTGRLLLMCLHTQTAQQQQDTRGAQVASVAQGVQRVGRHEREGQHGQRREDHVLGQHRHLVVVRREVFEQLRGHVPQQNQVGYDDQEQDHHQAVGSGLFGAAPQRLFHDLRVSGAAQLLTELTDDVQREH
mmetsp:Transcript_22990/g.42913  ORF Transcript_22990/g.42913 Transcript_22990/m.42913 type:complete len:298 (-) Transcript_22990:223-1116(-)